MQSTAKLLTAFILLLFILLLLGFETLQGCRNYCKMPGPNEMPIRNFCRKGSYNNLGQRMSCGYMP